MFGSSLINKKRYWPKQCPGDQIQKQFDKKKIVDADSVTGEIDGCPYTIMC